MFQPWPVAMDASIDIQFVHLDRGQPLYLN